MAGVVTLAVPRAAHSFAAALVQVTNNVDNPVQDQDVDALGRHPFLSSCSGQDSCQLSAVPANKEWVIQTISVAISIPPSSPPAIAELETTTGGITGFPVQFPVVSIIGGQHNRRFWICPSIGHRLRRPRHRTDMHVRGCASLEGCKYLLFDQRICHQCAVAATIRTLEQITNINDTRKRDLDSS